MKFGDETIVILSVHIIQNICSSTLTLNYQGKLCFIKLLWSLPCKAFVVMISQ